MSPALRALLSAIVEQMPDDVLLGVTSEWEDLGAHFCRLSFDVDSSREPLTVDVLMRDGFDPSACAAQVVDLAMRTETPLRGTQRRG